MVSVKNPVGLSMGILLRKYKVKIGNKSQQIPRYTGLCPRGHLSGVITPGMPLITSLHFTIDLQACPKVCRRDYEKIRNYHNLCIRFGSCEICHMNRALKCGNFTENVFPHLALHHLIIFQSVMANISLIIRATKLKIEVLTNFNKFFYFGSQFVNNMT